MNSGQVSDRRKAILGNIAKHGAICVKCEFFEKGKCLKLVKGCLSCRQKAAGRCPEKKW